MIFTRGLRVCLAVAPVDCKPLTGHPGPRLARQTLGRAAHHAADSAVCAWPAACAA
jgi:hypothetical protein